MKYFTLLISLLLFSICLKAQKDKIYLSSDLAFLPHEIKYGGLFNGDNYQNQFYISSYLLGIKLRSEELKYSVLSPAISYSRMYNNNYLSLYLYIGQIDWLAHYGLKVEPLLNVQSMKFDFINFELNIGLLLGLSLVAGIPTEFNSNEPYWGFKIGYAFFQPIFLTKKDFFKTKY